MEVFLAVLLWAVLGLPAAAWIARVIIRDDPHDTSLAAVLAGCALVLGPIASAMGALYWLCYAGLGLVVPEVRSARVQARLERRRSAILLQESRILTDRKWIDRAHEELGLPPVDWPDLPR